MHYTETCLNDFKHGSFTASLLIFFFISSIILTALPIITAPYMGMDGAMLLMVMMEVSLAILCYFVFLSRLSEFKSIRFRPSQLVFVIAPTLILQAIYISITKTQLNQDIAFNIDFMSMILIIFAIPFYEEVFYRGCLFGGIVSIYKKGIYLPVILTSLIFSLMHTQYSSPLEYALMFVCGAIFSYARIITKGLLLPIIAHSIMNAFVLFINTITSS